MRKRDGSLEEFDRNKLEISILKARATGVDTDEVAGIISQRVREGTPTSEIRTLVINELERLDTPAAQRFKSYRRTVFA